MTIDCNSDLEFEIWKLNLLLLLKFMDDFSPQEGIDILKYMTFISKDEPSLVEDIKHYVRDD